jgi:tRNA pseudouridine synthase 10
MTITAEGGRPIKRFIVGDNISPNISTLFDTPCLAQEFDFLDIIVKC